MSDNENIDINQGQDDEHKDLLLSYNPGDYSDEEGFSTRPKVNGVIKFSNKADMGASTKLDRKNPFWRLLRWPYRAPGIYPSSDI